MKKPESQPWVPCTIVGVTPPAVYPGCQRCGRRRDDGLAKCPFCQHESVRAHCVRLALTLMHSKWSDVVVVFGGLVPALFGCDAVSLSRFLTEECGSEDVRIACLSAVLRGRVAMMEWRTMSGGGLAAAAVGGPLFGPHEFIQELRRCLTAGACSAVVGAEPKTSAVPIDSLAGAGSGALVLGPDRRPALISSGGGGSADPATPPPSEHTRSSDTGANSSVGTSSSTCEQTGSAAGASPLPLSGHAALVYTPAALRAACSYVSPPQMFVPETVAKGRGSPGADGGRRSSDIRVIPFSVDPDDRRVV